MTKPSQSLLNQQNLHVLGVCDVMQVFVGDFESVDVFISHSPALLAK
jgi:hypothetical protein